jgi:putative transposase
VSFVDQHRGRFGVEPICDVLQVAPSTYYAAVKRPPSSRRIEDEKLSVELRRVYDENHEVYGAEKLWTQMNREGIGVGRDRVARLMRAQGLAGELRGKVWRTTFTAQTGSRPADLVDRKFEAEAPNRLWVADLTYVSTWAGVAYTAFVTDVFSR